MEVSYVRFRPLLYLKEDVFKCCSVLFALVWLLVLLQKLSNGFGDLCLTQWFLNWWLSTHFLFKLWIEKKNYVGVKMLASKEGRLSNQMYGSLGKS